MKARYLSHVFSLIAIGLFTLSTSAQDDAVNEFMKKQFYGNRVKAGSLLFDASFQRTGYASDERQGLTGNIGFGLGVGMSENFMFTAAYRRNRNEEVGPFEFGNPTLAYRTANNYAVGFRFLFNSVGGFIQPYAGAELLVSKVNFKENGADDPYLEETYGGGIVRAGLTCWISTFMALSFEPINLSLFGRWDKDEEFNSEFNADLSLVNPTLGISFLVNGRKP